MKSTIIAALSATILGSVATFAAAQETPHAGYRETGANKDWVGIYSPDRGGEKATASCAIYSRPKTSEVFKGDGTVDVMRGELAAFVAWTDKAVGDDGGEVSFMVGAPVVEGMHDAHSMTIDGDVRFDLVGVGDRLYVKPEDDNASLAAIRKGTEMVVTAQTIEGNVVKDSYSLMGVQATTAIQKAECS
jgi:hypothetical protein